MRNVWIVPGFSSDENDWCIPALLDLARAIARRCELHVVALQYPYRRDTYRIGEITVHSLGGANRGGVSNLLNWHEAVRLVDQLTADIVHAFWAYPSGVIAARLNARAPIVISLAGGELIDLPSIDYGLIGRRRVRWLLRWAMRRAKVITAGSKYLVKIGQQFLREGKFEFAPLGVDEALFYPTLGRPERSPHLLNVGSLEPVKDQAMLLRAFRCVVDHAPDARLVIAGQGRLAGRLHDLTRELDLSDRVEFRGEVAHQHLPELYRSASVFVQSSQHEAQGMAVLEAAACGTPIVGTGVGALFDLAPDAAVATPVGDGNALAHTLLDLLRDPDRATQIGRAAQQAVAREYSLERSADRFMSIYESLIHDRDCQ